NYRDQAILSKKLVTIKLDAPVNYEPENYERKDFDNEKLASLFDELEFKTLKTRILGMEETKDKVVSGKQGNLFEGFEEKNDEAVPVLDSHNKQKKNYILLQEMEQLDELREQIYMKKWLCFDTETTGLDPYLSELVGIALSCEKDKAYFYYHKGQSNNNLFLAIKDIIEDPNVLKIGQNLKYDIRVLKRYDIYCQGKLFDTMVAHYLLQPEQRHNLNMLSEHYLKYSPVKIEALIGPKGKKQKTMNDVALEELVYYACEDADITFQLYEIFVKELKENNLSKLAYEVEMPLVYVLAEMEHNGVKLDTHALKEYALILNKELKEIEQKIYDLAEVEFNISSPRQLGEVLFDRLKISADAKRTKTKQYSTSEDVLASLVEKHDIVPAVLEYRSVKKLLSTYVEALPKLINPITGRVHTSFNQTLVATGRLSSNNPNLQNIPIREERGREIRKSFVAGDQERLFIAADYSQIELRLMAHLSGDENMITAFRNNEDIHTATAARIYNIPEEQVTREMRNEAKTANFGIIYGISAFGLAQRLKIKRTEAKSLIEGYFKSFPGVKKYMDQSIASAREDSCVYTLMGRKRYLPDIHSRNSMVRGIAERNAINAPIQGSAADIIKIAMVKIHHRLKKEELKSKMILQVHDELIFDVFKKEVEIMTRIIKEEMENAWKLKVPLIVETGKGKNWFEAH
ncbi:MAG: DNA polymerase I, partial [Bacteroidota bacterium]